MFQNNGQLTGVKIGTATTVAIGKKKEIRLRFQRIDYCKSEKNSTYHYG